VKEKQQFRKRVMLVAINAQNLANSNTTTSEGDTF
jgi:hypothetical protein